MKIAFQNFLTTLRRYKTASVLNIAGLTLAFFAMYVVMTQVFFYVGYNQCVEDNDRVYMLGFGKHAYILQASKHRAILSGGLCYSFSQLDSAQYIRSYTALSLRSDPFVYRRAF